MKNDNIQPHRHMKTLEVQKADNCCEEGIIRLNAAKNLIGVQENNDRNPKFPQL